MSGTRTRTRRNPEAALKGLLAAGAVAGVVCGFGCSSDKSANPDAVTVTELKFPGSLTILDGGNGAVTLKWTGANNEKDFDGYNVYAMKDSGDATLTKLASSSIKLLDDTGTPVDQARQTLALFDYDPAGQKIESKGTPPAATASTSTSSSSSTSSSAPPISARPVHTVSTTSAGKRLLPTCKPGASDTTGIATCTATTDATAGQSVAGGMQPVNGVVTYTPPDTLKIGSTYCFVVLSSMAEGTKISQTSSNVACVTPKYKVAFKLAKMPSAKADNLKFDLNGWLAGCTATTCADPTTSFIATESSPKYHSPADTGPLYIEAPTSSSSSTQTYFVAGANASVLDLGYYTGFDDPTLPATAPVFSQDSNTYQTSSGATAPIINGNGYAIPGQSIPIVKNHVYVFAVADATLTTKYRYYWLFVSGDPTAGNSAVSVEMRVPKGVG